MQLATKGINYRSGFQLNRTWNALSKLSKATIYPAPDRPENETVILKDIREEEFASRFSIQLCGIREVTASRFR